MTKITFISASGIETEVEAADGDSLMETARANDIDGISAECGGEMMCATCHVYVDDGWMDRVGSASDDEREMLDFASCEVTGASRLCCQVKIASTLDGLIVRLPESQI